MNKYNHQQYPQAQQVSYQVKDIPPQKKHGLAFAQLLNCFGMLVLIGITLGITFAKSEILKLEFTEKFLSYQNDAFKLGINIWLWSIAGAAGIAFLLTLITWKKPAGIIFTAIFSLIISLVGSLVFITIPGTVFSLVGSIWILFAVRSYR